MESYYHEAERAVPIRGRYDVIVAGGGTAGLACAIAAARAGARTLVVDRLSILGGQFTNGIMGLFNALGDRREVVVQGIALELINRLKERGAVCEANFAEAQFVAYDPEAAKQLVNEILLGLPNLDVLYETWISAPMVADGRIRGLIVENKSGRSAYEAHCVVDCTADADVVYRAGGVCHTVKPEDAHPVSLLTKLGGVDQAAMFRYYAKHPDDTNNFPPSAEWVPGMFHKYGIGPELAAMELPEEYEYLRKWYIVLYETPNPGEMCLNMTGAMHVDATNSNDVSRALVESRRRIGQCLEVLKKALPGFENAFIAATSSLLGVRESRQIEGRYTLTRDDLITCRRQPDAVCTLSAPIGVHTADGAGVQFITPGIGNSFDIPLRCLLPKALKGVLVAGRCLSATHEAMGAARVMSGCMCMGQACGIVAAWAARHQCDPGDISNETLRSALLACGVFLKA